MDKTEIDIEAEALARRHDIDCEHVRAIFYMLAEVGWLAPNFPYNTALDEAIGHVGIEDALAIFEEENLANLAQKFQLVEYLSDLATPFHTLNEMAYLIGDFKKHLIFNQEHLILTGHPETTFGSSRWLDWHLNKLYYTKLPLFSPFIEPLAELDILLLESFVPNSTTYDRDLDGNLVFKYVWPKDPNHLELNLVDEEQIGNYTLDYTEANNIPGLTSEEVKTLEGIRNSLFGVKLEVLDSLSDSIKKRDTSDLWFKCFDIIRKKISLEDIQFLLKMDEFFSNIAGDSLHNHAYSPYIGTYINHNAGLSDLLEVIGHCEKEISIGTMDRICQRLSSLPVFESFSPYDYRLKSYYRTIKDHRVISGGFRKEYDSILNDFLSLEATEKEFWNEYRARVNDAIEDVVEVIIKQKIKRKIVHLYKPNIMNYSKWIKSHLETFGKPPPQSFDMQDEQPSRESNIFQKCGDYWTIAFGGITTSFKDSKGIRFIKFLLHEPGREFHVLDILRGSQVEKWLEGRTNSGRHSKNINIM